MKRKKLIIFFIFLFALSNTGLPIAMHFCQTMGVVPFSKCKMHEQSNNVCPAHADKTNSESKQDCCTDKIVFERNQENYIKITVDNTPVLFAAEFIILPVDEYLPEQTFSSRETSSSIKAEEPLYLKNSVLLI